MTARFSHAFKWQAVVDTIKYGEEEGLVFVANIFENGYNKLLSKLTSEEKARVIEMGDIYGEQSVGDIIAASNKPDEQTWGDWTSEYSSNQRFKYHTPEWLKKIQQLGDDTTPVTHLVLMDHANRTKNLHTLIAETNLTVISSTERYVNKPIGKDEDGDEMLAPVPDVRWLYGRPSLPDFDNLTDEVFDMYRRDGVNDLDSLIPVYDFSVQSFSYRQVLDMPITKRGPLVLRNGKPMFRAESIAEIFAWRGTGKTLFSLGLALHLAAGKSMPGLEITSPCKVLYVEGELPKAQLQERITQLSAGFDVPAGGFSLIAKSFEDDGTKQSPITINTEAGRLAIEAAIGKTGAQVLFLDSIASLAQINTNNEDQWHPIIEWTVKLRCKGICVVYLQQAGKGGEQRGHSVSEDRIDLAIRLTATNTNPSGEAAFKMTFTKEREGSLEPLSLHCTKGAWAIDEGKQPAKSPKTRKNAGHKKILEALNKGESQKDIAKRLRVSLRTISQIKKETTTNDNPSTDVSS